MTNKSWLEIAKELPLGHKTRSQCHECGTTDKSLIVNHSHKAYNAYCFRCGSQPFEMKGEMSLEELKQMKELNHAAHTSKLKLALPEDFSHDIPLEGRLWLYSGGITESTWKEFGIGYSESLRRVILPVYNDKKALVWYQCRAVFKGQSPKYIQPSDGRDTVIFKCGNSISNKQCVIVEDILSAIRVGKHTVAASILGTKITTSQAQALSQFDTVVTWLDSDKAGVKGAQAIRKTLQLVTRVTNVVTKKDPKCLSDEQIRQELSNVT